MKKIFFIVLITASLAGAAIVCKKALADHTHSDLDQKPSNIFDLGHSGGLDQNGGHYDRSTGIYHYHR